jgi:hypothetical protein
VFGTEKGFKVLFVKGPPLPDAGVLGVSSFAERLKSGIYRSGSVYMAACHVTTKHFKRAMIMSERWKESGISVTNFSDFERLGRGRGRMT